MLLQTWALFALAILLASISPGPNILIVIVNTLKYGKTGALMTISGNLLCLFCVALLASLGVGTLIATAPIAYQAMKIAGGLYLAWLGFKLIRQSFFMSEPVTINSERLHPKNTSKNILFFEAFMVSASNPKSILFLTAIFPQFLDPSASLPLQFSIMFATIIGIVSIVHGTYAAMAFSLRRKNISLKARQWMARATGTTFLGLGFGLAFTK